MLPERPARTVGRYHLETELGASPTTEVWSARDPKDPERELVLKIFRSLDDAAVLAAGLATAQSLDHPALLRVLDFGRDGDLTFAVMPRVRGASLAEILPRLAAQRRPFPAHVVTYVGTQVCDLLAAASKARLDGKIAPLVHGHLSPADIFLDTSGWLGVADLGTPATESHPAPTGARIVRGKPGYVAPEQITGAVADSRSDLFSLGVILFEAATLKPLFGAEGPRATLEAVLERPAPRVKDAVLGFPEAVGAVLGRLLEKNPGDRYPTAEAAREGFVAAERSLTTKGPEAARSSLAELVAQALPELGVRPRVAVDRAMTERSEAPATHPLERSRVTETKKSGALEGVLSELAREDGETEMTSPKDVDGPTQTIKTEPKSDTAEAKARSDDGVVRIEKVAVSKPKAADKSPEPPKEAPKVEAAKAEAKAEAAKEAESGRPRRAPERRASSLSALEPSQVERARRELSTSRGDRPELPKPSTQENGMVEKIGEALEDPVRQKKIFIGLGAGIVILLAGVALMPGSDVRDRALQAKVTAGEYEAAETYFIENIDDFAYPKSAFEIAALARDRRLGLLTMEEAVAKLKADAAERSIKDETKPKAPEEILEIVLTSDLPEAPEDGAQRAKFGAARKLLQQGIAAMDRADDANAHKALQDCLQVLELPACHLRLAVLYDRRNEIGKSVRHFRRYLDLKPDASEREIIEKKLLRAEGRF
ncbi:MAG: serine/threonine protein kinase [Deltaproteobacteria bacterium]|nr:serine/threonine protein kinase [Deltaproteobacteria bacterium]